MTGALRTLRRPLSGRDPAEPHRASTPLELLFDLSFVVAVATAAVELEHGIAGDHVGTAVGRYLTVFFAIWWAWMNFTWFASAYDTDDVPYRLLTLVQMAGVLVLAAGVHDAFSGADFTLVTVGYVIMRVPLVAQWLRAARDDPDRRPVAVRYALGVTVVQLGWLLRLALPGGTWLVSFLVLAVADVAVPIWSERSGASTRWHPEHIAERYGLFTLIVLGEVILGATTAVQAALTEEGASTTLLSVAAGGLLLVFGLWWAYFCRPAAEALRVDRSVAFLWGYGHYLVFAGIGALGAGLEVATAAARHEAEVGGRTAALSVAVPVAVTLLVVGALQTRLAAGRAVLLRYAAAAALVLLAALLPLTPAVVAMGVAVGGLVTVEVVRDARARVGDGDAS